MEARGHSQSWRTYLPECSRTFSRPATKDGEGGVADAGGRIHKSVTMATSTELLTDRRYQVRKPLISGEHHSSVFKKTRPLRTTPQEKHLDVTRGAEPPFDTSSLTRAGAEVTPESLRLSHSDISSGSVSREDLDSPLTFSELRAVLDHEEPTFTSLSPGRRSAGPSFLSSILEVQRLDPPLRPRLTSTVLNPTYTPRSGSSRTGQTPIRSSGGTSKVSSMSQYRADYWACAIPKACPPSPDRRSAAWDPNQEYQALLDYTYPLRPGPQLTQWNSSRVSTDPNLQDSGIELDHHCGSTSISGWGFRDPGTFSPGQSSPDLQTFTEGLSSSGPASTRSTTVLPLSRSLWGEEDEEFRRLPEKLEELQQLSTQVRDMTAQLRQPVRTGWGSLGPGSKSIISSQSPSEEEEAEAKEPEDRSQDPAEKRSPAQMAAVHSDPEAGKGSGPRVPPAGGGPTQSGIREGDHLHGFTRSASQRSHQEKKDSLMQHMQVFCSHLDQLIQQLHGLSETTVPSGDRDGGKSSQRFFREESSQDLLTSSILQTGHLLLSCINSTSPFLRDTLVLIQRQTLSSSIQSTMDRLTRPKTAQQSRLEGPGSEEVQGSGF